MELIPDRAQYTPGTAVTIELSEGASGEIVVTRLDREVARVPVPAGATALELGSFDAGGYGVRLGEATTAFDVAASPFERPRYGFVARLADDADIEAVTLNFRRLHLNLAQLYDWAYKHSTLLPPTERYIDPLGLERSLDVVNAMSSALAASGSVPLGYSAVYAVGHDEADEWAQSLLRRPDGEVYRLGENFLVLLDPAEPRWLEHYLGELERVVASTSIEGFHLDQYGWPKLAVRGDGATVDLAESFPALLDAVRAHLPETPFLFNNVNDFPTYATAGTGQSGTYIEVWPPHSTLQDLAQLAATTRALRPEHPPIFSAYLTCFEQDEAGAMNAAELVMATIFSNGASHLLLGEDRNALTRPYYPTNHRLSEPAAERFVPWYDFQVRYGELLYDPQQVDVTETFTGGINGDLTFTGAPSSTKALAGHVWTRVVRTSFGIVVHLVDLRAQTDTEWDAVKHDPGICEGLQAAISFLAPDSSILFASVGQPDMVTLTASGVASSAQSDALSAAQSSATFAIPAFRAWAVMLIPTTMAG